MLKDLHNVLDDPITVALEVKGIDYRSQFPIRDQLTALTSSICGICMCPKTSSFATLQGEKTYILFCDRAPHGDAEGSVPGKPSYIPLLLQWQQRHSSEVEKAIRQYLLWL